MRTQERASVPSDLSQLPGSGTSSHYRALPLAETLADPKGDPTFISHAANHQWKSRRERGYDWKADVFSYIRDNYGHWITHRVLKQSDLKIVDRPLWDALQKRLGAEPLPNDLYLPSQKEAALSADATERAAQEAVRRYRNEVQARYRARKERL